MNKKDISIATITWVRNQEEETVVREALQHLARLEVPVFITDAGSGSNFLTFLRSCPHFRLSKASLRGPCTQAKNSLREAYQAGSSFILYTEPDKQDFFQQGLPRLLNQIAVNKQSGIVMASRSPAAFASFPPFQKMTETTINNCCEEIIGNPVDYTYGPFLLNRQLVPYLQQLPEEIGWGWRPYAFHIAKRLGLNVEAFVDDYFCPPAQQGDTPAERIYRMRQLSQNIQGLVLAATVQLPNSFPE